MDIEEVIRRWREASTVEEELKERVIERFRQAVAAANVREALSRPAGNIELWREKGFEVVLENQWVTGTFDRVVIGKDGQGNALRATILDFKTDVVADDADLEHRAEHYRPQLSLYRSALSRMLRIEPEDIALKIVFLHSGEVHSLE